MTSLALLAAGLAAVGASPSTADVVHHFTLVRDGKPAATIVVAAEPTPSARLAALELQNHVRLITGVVLPIARDTQPVRGARVLVGESAATRDMGLTSERFDPQEYLIRFRPDTLILIGRDWQDTPENRAVAGISTNWVHLEDSRTRIDYGAVTGTTELGGDLNRGDIELPGLYDDQGTCYATYDFLERFCGVRWYGPSAANVVMPRRRTLEVTGPDVRRAPAFSHREGLAYGTSTWPINKGLWDDPSPQELALFARRMREGGDRWAANHSFVAYRDRFLKPEDAAKRATGWPLRPELFEGEHPEYFAVGNTAGEGQFCYTNPGLIHQVAQDARDFFDGKGIRGTAPALGDYFAVVPLDNSRWCQCASCQGELRRSADLASPHFSNGSASRYLFGFVNNVAREVAKTHPAKHIATLAYSDYAYYPEGMALEPNVSVAPCLQTRIYWAPNIKTNDVETFYRPWAKLAKERPIYLWLYYCFPEENALGRRYHCFPGFMAHTAAENIRMYHRDGIRGVFLCGYGEQVDYYVTVKLLDDPDQDVDALLDEFFRLYYGSAAEPMKRLYLRIESIYSDPANYPEDVRTEERQFHQNEEIAWRWLGTEERMEELGGLMAQARKLASTRQERERVALFDRGVWQYMVEGREGYLSGRGQR